MANKPTECCGLFRAKEETEWIRDGPWLMLECRPGFGCKGFKTKLRAMGELANENSSWLGWTPGTRLAKYAVVGPGGTFFVSSRQVGGRRRYTVRSFDGKTGACEPVGGADWFEHGSDATAHARRLAEGESEELEALPA